MNSKQLAEMYLTELWNDADHLNNLTMSAKHAGIAGNYDRALEQLEYARKPAGLTAEILESNFRPIDRAEVRDEIEARGMA